MGIRASPAHVLRPKEVLFCWAACSRTTHLSKPDLARGQEHDGAPQRPAQGASATWPHVQRMRGKPHCARQLGGGMAIMPPDAHQTSASGPYGCMRMRASPRCSCGSRRLTVRSSRSAASTSGAMNQLLPHCVAGRPQRRLVDQQRRVFAHCSSHAERARWLPRAPHLPVVVVAHAAVLVDRARQAPVGHAELGESADQDV